MSISGAEISNDVQLILQIANPVVLTILTYDTARLNTNPVVNEQFFQKDDLSNL